jgi:hypothetical protein
MADLNTIAQLLAGAERVIERFGAPGYTLIRKSQESTLIDPLHPTKGYQRVETSYPIELAARSTYNQSFINGETIKIDDVKLYIQPEMIATPPVESDTVTFGVEIWKVVNVDTYKFGEADVLYIVRVRK